jgi:hypothetical protein
MGQELGPDAVCSKEVEADIRVINQGDRSPNSFWNE